MKKNSLPLTKRDLLFGAINGALFGSMFIFVLANTNYLFVHPLFIFIFFIIFAIIGIAIGYFLSRFVASFFFQLAKFGAVGASNFSVDLGVLSLLMFFTNIASGPFFTLFKTISFFCAVTNSYFWNKFWSFEDKSKNDIKKEFSQFLLVSITGAIINIGVSHVMVNIIGAPSSFEPKIWATLSAATSAISVLLWNFLGYKFIVFKK